MPNKARLLRIAALLLTVAVLLTLSIIFADAFARTRRLHRVLAYARAAADEFAVPLPLVLAVTEAESDFKPNARSDAGACGLMQLLPDTFADIHKRLLLEQHDADKIFEPRTNIRCGTCYLAYLHERFGDWRVTIAAYNAGEGRVAEWLTDARYGNGKTLQKIPYPETAQYLKKVLAAYEKYSQKYPQKGVSI